MGTACSCSRLCRHSRKCETATALTRREQLEQSLRLSTSSSVFSDTSGAEIDSVSRAVASMLSASKALHIKFEALNLKSNPIAAGAAGQVYKGKFGKVEIAAKSLFSQMIDCTDVRELMDEMQMLCLLEHPHVVRLLGLSVGGHTGEPQIYLVYEYCPLTLEHVVEGRVYTVSTLCRIWHQLCDGVDHMHQHEVAHRDLKPANILVSLEGNIKIADLGMAQVCGASRWVLGEGTPGYNPPEAFQVKEDDYVELKWDIFSMAFLLWYLWHRQVPWKEMDSDQVQEAVLAGQRPPFFPDTPRELAALVIECWDDTPDLRPSSAELKRRESTLSQALKKSSLGAFHRRHERGSPLLWPCPAPEKSSTPPHQGHLSGTRFLLLPPDRDQLPTRS